MSADRFDGGGALLAFGSDRSGDDGIEVRVNFGLFAGREVTPAEIDVLGRELVERVESVTVVAEQRHEIGRTAHAALHQVAVKVGARDLPADAGEVAELRGRLLEITERWAHACIAERHDPVSDELQEPLSELGRTGPSMR